MKKKILVFNVGSSSIKFSYYINNQKIYSNQIENLKSKKNLKKSFYTINKLIPQTPNIILHRIVHGGDISKPTLITKQILNKISKFNIYAPTHNINQLEIIKLCTSYNKKQYAVFDTMFFSNLPKISSYYPLPKKIIKKYKIKRYGFHGLSHKNVTKDLKGKTISIHLAQGSSISAISDNKPLDTSMGLTPLEGLTMQTRVGDIDPGIIEFLSKKEKNLQQILYKDSGLKSITKYDDFRKILKNLNNKNTKFAYNLFIYKIIKYIGSYIAILNGIDNLVFTGKIGKGSPRIRQDICKQLKYLNIRINKKDNLQNKELISLKNSKIKVYSRESQEENQMIEEYLNQFQK